MTFPTMSLRQRGLAVNIEHKQDAELARLEQLLSDALRQGGSSRRDSRAPKSAMGVALAEACRIARARGLNPEQVIIMLKGCWERLRDSSYPTRDDAQEALDRAVTACIEQYFAEQTSSSASRAPFPQ